MRVFHFPPHAQGDESLVYISCHIGVEMQGEFLHMMVIDQTVYFLFQTIGKQDGGFDRTCPEARGAVL